MAIEIEVVPIIKLDHGRLQEQIKHFLRAELIHFLSTLLRRKCKACPKD